MVICLGTFSKTKLIYWVWLITVFEIDNSIEYDRREKFPDSAAYGNCSVIVRIRPTTLFVQRGDNAIVPWVSTCVETLIKYFAKEQ